MDLTGAASIADGADICAFELPSVIAVSVRFEGLVMKENSSGCLARIYLTNQNGEMHVAITNSLGYYQFADVQTGKCQLNLDVGREKPLIKAA